MDKIYEVKETDQHGTRHVRFIKFKHECYELIESRRWDYSTPSIYELEIIRLGNGFLIINEKII